MEQDYRKFILLCGISGYFQIYYFILQDRETFQTNGRFSEIWDLKKKKERSFYIEGEEGIHRARPWMMAITFSIYWLE